MANLSKYTKSFIRKPDFDFDHYQLEKKPVDDNDQFAVNVFNRDKKYWIERRKEQRKEQKQLLKWSELHSRLFDLVQNNRRWNNAWMLIGRENWETAFNQAFEILKSGGTEEEALMVIGEWLDWYRQAKHEVEQEIENQIISKQQKFDFGD
jgi:hypothetical protein